MPQRESAPGHWPAIEPRELPHVLVRAIESAHHGITIAANTPDRPLVYANTAFVQLTGYPIAEVLGRNCRFLQGPDTDRAVVAEISAALTDAREVGVELLNYRRDGTSFWNDVTISVVRDPHTRDVTHFIGTQTDVTERVEQGRRLTRLAHTDPITGLLNRSRITARLAEHLATGPASAAIAVGVDIDEFHRINEDFDYETGNLVLVEVARRLRSIASDADWVARLDADSFLLVRPTAATSGPDAAALIVRAVGRAVGVPVSAAGMSIPVRVSCGAASSPADGRTADDLIAAAGRALQAGRHTSAVHPRPRG